MNDQNNNQKPDLTKVYEMIHQENRWNRITSLGQTVVVLIPSLVLLWKSLKPKKLSTKQRLMRNRAIQARLQLEEKFILQEAVYEAELKHMETGLEPATKQSDLFSSLKQQGESLLKDKINQVNKVVDDKLKQAKTAVSDKLPVDQLTSLWIKKS